MPKVPAPINSFAIDAAEKAFRKAHPELKGRQLTMDPSDAELRAEWLKLYTQYNGQVTPRPEKSGKARDENSCKNLPRGALEVYIYEPKRKPDDWHGHIGLVLQQKDGSYIRYSMQAVNPNLQGADQVQYLIWWQQTVVKKQRFAKGTRPKLFGSSGSDVVRIPTTDAAKIQAAVDEYIKDKPHYHVITNNCADFVNDCVNEAKDVSLWDHTLPKTYFQAVTRTYPDCVIK
jgi:hypothetical protein